ncbi:hypothetical protein BT63DRAFT_428502 [Microthyrium microscopicum]|uniref:ABM domain-containing protein n=1 Tax=Microthyrium microscopicum TaxID=703497 RepID=A0A6A6U2Q2_9PEZI|nr:hypothetical protein BT63DRAFT_428502 [Microthyrium microscopicum]
MTTPVTIHVTLPIKAGSEDEFFKALKLLFDEALQDETLLRAEILTSAEPGTIRMVEVWNADDATLMAVSSGCLWCLRFRC